MTTKLVSDIIVITSETKRRVVMKFHRPYNKLKGMLREKSLTYENLGKLLGVSKATIARKINGESDFLISETDILEQHGIPRNIFYT